jgi:hypothetical protein
MRVIVDNLYILPITTNFGEKGLIFSKNKNMPIKRLLKAKMAGFVKPFGLEEPLFYW